ncbi:MAG TPA: DUF2723 domain-containing protein [Polyangiales bacterium]|nr:DUF2723 domain-containing protein [Polyangiales bacterium]
MALRAPRSTWFATSSLALYFVGSMARDLSLYDSGELALAAVQLGLAHPPGQPLHTLLGFFLSRLSFAAPLVGVNLLSAIPSALTLIPATSLGQRMLGERVSPAAVSGMPWLLAACALHPCVWEPATRVEVYALASLGAVWTLAAAAQFAEPGIELSGASARTMLWLGSVLGLTASVNPVIALAAAVAITPALVAAIATRPAAFSRKFRTARVLALCAIGGGLIGLMPYGYLPLVANRTDVMIWGAPHDLQSYLHYVLLRDYIHNQAITFALWSSHVADWLQWAGRAGLWPVLALGLIAHLVFGGRGSNRVTVPLIFVLLLANIAANVVWHVEVPDYNGYLAAPLWALAAGAIGLGLREYRSRALQSGALVLALGCVVSALASPPSPLLRTRNTDRLARELAERVLREAPPNAIVISETDAVTGALFYLQGAERARPDVSVLAYGLASSSWHWDQLLRAHRDLKPIALDGPGGRAARVQRLLTANPDRPITLEGWYTGRELGLAMCEGGLFLRAGRACDGEHHQNPAVAEAIAAQLARLGDGSPSVKGELAQSSYHLGEALWRLGDPASAHAVLLSGVPMSAWPARTLKSGFERAPALPAAAPAFVYERSAALGDPGRNLFLAGAIVGATGDRDLAREYVQAAAALDLAEATRMLARQAQLQRAAR